MSNDESSSLLHSFSPDRPVPTQLEVFRNKIVEEVIPGEIAEFIASKKCCRHFFYLKSEHKSIIHEFARMNHLFSQDERDPRGKESVRVYKQDCPSFIKGETNVVLKEESRNEIKKLLSNRPVTSFEQDCVNADIMRPMATKPKMEPHLFCIGSNRESIPSPEIALKVQSSPDYNIVLESINCNRVTIVAAVKGFGKSTVIPKLLVQEYALNQKNCKVVVVGTHRTTAIINSETVSAAINQSVGNTVGFQVRLESQTNEYSNLIYTTSIFFLRCLMGRHPKEALQKITHIIIDDCQEHNPYSDITMFEIKDVLIFLPQLKVILLTTPDYSLPLKSYFGEGNIVSFPGHSETIRKYHLEEILDNFNIEMDVLVPKSSDNLRSQPDSKVHLHIDKLLDDYMETGSDQSFNVFMYSLETHEVSVDIQHSKKKTTALMCAAFHNRLDHVEVLMLEKKANPRLSDLNYKTAAVYANSRRFFDCSQFINKCLHEKELLELSSTYKTCYYEDYRNELEGMHVDLKLIAELIKWIYKSYNNVQQNVTVVYLPTYEYIIRMNYHLLLEKILGNVPHDLEISLVHDDIQKDQLAKLKGGEFFNCLSLPLLKCIENDSQNLPLLPIFSASDHTSLDPIVVNLTTLLTLARFEP